MSWYASSAVAGDLSGELVTGWVARIDGMHRLIPDVPAMADAIGLSERQLHRRCVGAFGYAPSTLRRILRLQRFLRLARHPGAPRDLAGLALAAGYADQLHLVRDCRTIAGASPRTLIGR